MALYATVEDLYAEGVDDSNTSVRLTRVLQRASALIDAWCHRWFWARPMTLLLDGTGTDMLQIGPPIIGLTRVRRISDGSIILPTPDELIDLSTIIVYNRHMQGLTDPDDRNSPKLRFKYQWVDGAPRRLIDFSSDWWPSGVQNIELQGYFGYTDPDPDEVVAPGGFPLGKTPDLIKTACIMLAVRDLLPLADVSGRTEAALESRITNMRTRDQSISYASTNSSTGGTSGTISSASGIAGNPEVMSILAQYCRPPTLGAV